MMANGSITRNPLALFAGLAIAAAAGAATSYGFGIRQPIFDDIGFQEARFALIIPSQVCIAVGALAAGFFASTRPIRGLAVLAISIAGGLIFMSDAVLYNDAGTPTRIALACAFSGVGSSLIVLAGLALVQALDSGRALAVSLALALVSGVPVGMRLFGLNESGSGLYYTALGACAAIALLGAPASVPLAQNRLAFAPVGPVPISVRAAPSQTLPLALMIAALSVAGWATFLAPQIQSGFGETTDLYSMALLVALGLAASFLGEAAGARLAILLIAGALAWMFTGGPAWPGPLGGNLSFSLADFIAIALASRYGQPREAAMRTGALMALGTVIYIPLNLIAINFENQYGVFNDVSVWQLGLAIAASALVLLLLLRLPQARTTAAAW